MPFPCGRLPPALRRLGNFVRALVFANIAPHAQPAQTAESLAHQQLSTDGMGKRLSHLVQPDQLPNVGLRELFVVAPSP